MWANTIELLHILQKKISSLSWSIWRVKELRTGGRDSCSTWTATLKVCYLYDTKRKGNVFFQKCLKFLRTILPKRRTIKVVYFFVFAKSFNLGKETFRLWNKIYFIQFTESDKKHFIPILLLLLSIDSPYCAVDWDHYYWWRELKIH